MEGGGMKSTEWKMRLYGYFMPTILKSLGRHMKE